MTLTKEWLLKTITELEEERDAVPGAVNEDAAKALEAMKLALVSLEAEPLGYIDAEYAGLLKSGHIESCSVYAEPGEGCIALYVAQPAAVSVPLAIHDEDFEKALSVLNDTLDDSGDSERGLLLALDKVGIEVRSDACHAAMLQGADGNSPVIQDGWVACSERMPEESGRYWCYIEEQNDLGKSHYQWNCSWNGERWWVESENGGRVTHWQPLPSPPAK